MAQSVQEPASKVPPTAHDWATFRKEPLFFSSAQLARYSRTEVDPYVIEISKSLCRSFPLCLEAKNHLGRKFRCAPEVAKESESTGSELPSVVSQIAESEEGLLFLGILGVLTEYYNNTSVATVFDELAKWKKVPEDLAPTAQSWKTVATLLGNRLGSDEFRSAVDRYTQLGQDSITHDLQHTDGFTVMVALNTMGDLSCGREKGTPTAYVGKDAGWLAAVAEWLFDLKIELRSQKSCVLFSNSGKEKPQFSFQFKPPGVPVDGLPLKSVPLVPRQKTEEK